MDLVQLLLRCGIVPCVVFPRRTHVLLLYRNLSECPIGQDRHLGKEFNILFPSPTTVRLINLLGDASTTSATTTLDKPRQIPFVLTRRAFIACLIRERYITPQTQMLLGKINKNYKNNVFHVCLY